MLVGICGSLLTLIENWGVFLTAKLIVGVAIGLTGVIVARYIEEWVPLKWFGISQAISLTCLQFGVLLSTLFGSILPDEEDEAALESNKTWRIIFLLQPALYLTVLILFYAFVRIDPPKFYLLTGQEHEAKEAVQRIYVTNGDQLKIDNILTFI
mmetsp:Transcript_14901/g.20187  ORF Transcript_14901/g.20187 Transcript_14901/m.20187 type:complete len:154 (+) Transcript_14901:521-982(+)